MEDNSISVPKIKIHFKRRNETIRRVLKTERNESGNTNTSPTNLNITKITAIQSKLQSNYLLTANLKAEGGMGKKPLGRGPNKKSVSLKTITFCQNVGFNFNHKEFSQDYSNKNLLSDSYERLKLKWELLKMLADKFPKQSNEIIKTYKFFITENLLNNQEYKANINSDKGKESKMLNLDYFKQLMTLGGVGSNHVLVNKIFCVFDYNYKNLIDGREFVCALILMKPEPYDLKIKSIISIIDIMNTGYIYETQILDTLIPSMFSLSLKYELREEVHDIFDRCSDGLENQIQKNILIKEFLRNQSFINVIHRNYCLIRSVYQLIENDISRNVTHPAKFALGMNEKPKGIYPKILSKLSKIIQEQETVYKRTSSTYAKLRETAKMKALNNNQIFIEDERFNMFSNL